MTNAKNLILRASAGTGKTFSLTSRMIRLLSQKGMNGTYVVSPAEILALTFSRAAAYEIYAKLVERLATAAENERNAQETNQQVGLSLTPSDYCHLLRRVLAVQHIDTIATLDSFILRMLQFKSLELGFPGGIKVIEKAEQIEAITRATETALSDNEAEILKRHLDELDEGGSKRNVQERLVKMMNENLDLLQGHGALLERTTDEICATLGIDFTAAHRPICTLEKALHDHPEWESYAAFPGIVGLIEHIQAWDKQTDIIPQKGHEKKFAEALLNDPEGASYYEFGRTDKCKPFPSSVRKAAIADLKTMLHGVLHEKVRRQLLTLKLVKTIDAVYDRQTRQQGRLTFADLPWQLLKHANQTDQFQNIEYYFDTRFTHWALDEFQDTSLLQWACLKELIENAAGDMDGRTVTIVGDLKQAIYAWRGGEERLFSHLMESPEFKAPYGDVQNLATSYRYEKHTCDFINFVFGEESMRYLQQQLNAKLNNLSKPLLSNWLHPNAWMIHHPNTDKKGLPLANDSVRVIEVPKKDDNGNRLYDALGDEIEALWSLRQPLEAQGEIPKETFAVLVMKNDQGEEIANYLRSRQLPAVWEGESDITDLPTVRSLLALLQLAEHPHDTLAWGMCSYTPIRNILFPTSETPEAIAQNVSRQLTANGLTRTLIDWVSRCCAEPHHLDPLSKERLIRLVSAAEAFEKRASAEQTMENFLAFLEEQTFRTIVKNPSLIRVITIDRSKGLGFDHVFVPIYEHKSFLTPKSNPYFNTQEPGDETPWTIASILNEELKDALQFFPKLSQAREARIDQQILAAIHKFYVALTRSKRSLTVILQKTSKNDVFQEKISFSTFLKEILSKSDFVPQQLLFGELIYQAGERPTTLKVYKKNSEEAFQLPLFPASATAISSHSPSDVNEDAIAISNLFAQNYRRAAQRGSDIHDRYATIAWIDPANPKNDLEKYILKTPLREAFIKPEGPVDVWVEYSYERIENNQRRPGRFDRVVITGKGDTRQAIIYDIKSNYRPKELPIEDFYKQMKATYTPQMNAYRHDLSHLLNLPPSSIQTTLLLLSTKTLLPI
ncbi:MAG: UvrD-helicase domain-containing protein [bacterium]|nr:UvrD-helicase domain-containing protein [bacterium]